MHVDKKNSVEDAINLACHSSLLCRNDVLAMKGLLFELLNDAEMFYSDYPMLVVLGGIPGVGKSAFCASYYSDKCFVIKPERLKDLYSNCDGFSGDKLLRELDAFSSRLLEVLLSILIILSCNILVECPSLGFDYWRKVFFSNYVDLRKYYKKLVVLLAPTDVCFQSICYQCQEKKIRDNDNSLELITLPLLFEEAKKQEKVLLEFFNSNLFDDVQLWGKSSMLSGFEWVDINRFKESIMV